jgi:hypothetical protein
MPCLSELLLILSGLAAHPMEYVMRGKAHTMSFSIRWGERHDQSLTSPLNFLPRLDSLQETRPRRAMTRSHGMGCVWLRRASLLIRQNICHEVR